MVIDMHRKTKLVLLLWNCIALVLLLIAWFYVSFFVDLRTRMRITELDRACVINEVQLKKSFPELANNLRCDLGKWVGKDYHDVTNKVFLGGTIVVGINIILLLVVLRETKRTSIESDENGAEMMSTCSSRHD